MNCKACLAIIAVSLFLGLNAPLSGQTSRSKNTSAASATSTQAPVRGAKPSQSAGNSRSSAGRRTSSSGTPHRKELTPTATVDTTKSHPLTKVPLNSLDSAVILKHINDARFHMSGVNRVPLPPGLVSNTENGGRVLRTFDNRTYELRFDGSLSRFWHGDTLAEYRKDGTPSLIHTQDVTMVRGTREQFYFDSQLPGGTHVVGWGPHEGYVERVVPSGGGRYMQRTYLVRGRQITAVFHTVDFNGVTLALYVPQRRYRPAFYTSVERKWPRGLHFGWPLLNENWAEPYRQHFRREYPSFSSWLADYLFAGILQAEFVSSPQTI